MIPQPEVEPSSDDELSDTYVAQQVAALAAGWDEPEMDDYDDYDAKRPRI